MVKSPIEYFEAQNFSADVTGGNELSPTERLFMQKYLGVDSDSGSGSAVLEKLPTVHGAPDVVVKELEPAVSVDESLREEAQIQLVGFHMNDQLYTIPTQVVQEVIRAMSASRLPMTAPMVSGIINLRGRVTPLVRLRDILELPPPRTGQPDRFTIICRCRGLQLGLQIDHVHSMYRVDQKDIQWNVEVQLGINSDCVSGLFKLDEKLIPIVSVERIVDTMLQA